MGMFDYETNFNPAEPLWQRYSKQAEQQRQGLMRDVVDPFIEEKTGYVSPKAKMQRMAAQTDLSDMNSVKNTFNTIMSHSPTAAAKWLKSVEPLIKSTIEQQKVAAQMMPKPKQRKIVKDAQGRQRYVDTGELVFPGVTPPKKDETLTIKSPTKQDADMITKEIDSHYQTGFLDMLDASLPEGMTQESLVDFIFRYKQFNPQETTITVVEKLLKGTIDPKQTIRKTGSVSTGNSRKVPSVNPIPQ